MVRTLLNTIHKRTRTAAITRSIPIRRPLTTTRPAHDRQPTFTTPEHSPPAPVLPHPAQPPPPPTSFVEDSAATFQTVFRYAVFASVGVVLVGVGGMTALHMWVEKVELAQPRFGAGGPGSEADADRQRWEEELDGWSGGYRGGGTDPRLGVLARSAIRGAWISQNWGGGAVASSVPTKLGSSPFVPGGAMIGSVNAAANKQVSDAGWRLTESYLVFALDKAAKKGISLLFPDTTATAPGQRQHQIDRAAVELEERLAGIRERIGGRFKLEQAREGWERIYYALWTSHEASGWEKRERIRATKKLGDISARLAEYWKEGTEERRMEKTRAEGWFLGGLLPALVDMDAQGDSVVRNTLSTKSASPWTSFFAFWSRSHPTPTITPITPVPANVRPEVATLIRLLDHHTRISTPTTTSTDPASSRAILSSLVSLETFLARDRDLLAAQAVQRASLAYANSLHGSPHFSSRKRITTWLTAQGGYTPARPSDVDSVTPEGSPLLPWSDRSWVAPSLSQIFLITRTSLFSTHLAEVTLALGKSDPPPSLTLLQGAINDSERAISVLSNSPFLNPLTAWEKLSNSESTRQRKEFVKISTGLVRDARVTGAMASRLVAFVHEAGCGGLANVKKLSRGELKKVKEWCGGDAVAEAFYAKAMELASGRLGTGSEKAQQEQREVDPQSLVDERGYKEATKGFERTRARVLEQQKKKASDVTEA